MASSRVDLPPVADCRSQCISSCKSLMTTEGPFVIPGPDPDDYPICGNFFDDEFHVKGPGVSGREADVELDHK